MGCNVNKISGRSIFYIHESIVIFIVTAPPQRFHLLFDECVAIWSIVFLTIQLCAHCADESNTECLKMDARKIFMKIHFQNRKRQYQIFEINSMRLTDEHDEKYCQRNHNIHPPFFGSFILLFLLDQIHARIKFN